jgi:hypothetical protein
LVSATLPVHPSANVKVDTHYRRFRPCPKDGRTLAGIMKTDRELDPSIPKSRAVASRFRFTFTRGFLTRSFGPSSIAYQPLVSRTSEAPQPTSQKHALDQLQWCASPDAPPTYDFSMVYHKLPAIRQDYCTHTRLNS